MPKHFSATKDLRDSERYQETEALYRAIYRPGSGLISDAAEASTNGRYVAFAGTIVDTLDGSPPTRICLTDIASSDTRVVTYGPHNDKTPKFSPDGTKIAFLSDRHKPGDFQLYVLDLKTGASQRTPGVEGWVEYLAWAPNGKRVLLGVAGHGADLSGGQGAVTSKKTAGEGPSWLPEVEAGDEAHHWRRAWVYELASDRAREISIPDLNIWEASWCGNDQIVAIVSAGPQEGAWYNAHLELLDIRSGSRTKLHTAEGDQLGFPSASATGSLVAVIQAVCSDRGIVAGELLLIDPNSGRVRSIETRGVDITYLEWRSEQRLLLAGHRGFETVILLYDAQAEVLSEVWCAAELTAGNPFASVAGLNETGDCILIAEGFARSPEIGVIRSGQYACVKSFDLGYAEQAKAIVAIERVHWAAPDSLNIQGWLLKPQGAGPHALVMGVHGGPVWHWRPMWLGRRGIHILMLLRQGYAVFLPNPRGSTGRGSEFVRKVVGDMGGADTDDYLSGLTLLVERGIADPKRLGVTGGSYGGFMTAWLVSQDARFAAAVAVAPVTNHVTEHLLSNIPHFTAMFLKDQYRDTNGKYYSRSPLLHAQRVKTPVLNICGALDRCTPPEEAMQFHSALRENGVTSVLVRYPNEGHGVRQWPASIDYATRLVGWFEEHMPAREDG